MQWQQARKIVHFNGAFHISFSCVSNTMHVNGIVGAGVARARGSIRELGVLLRFWQFCVTSEQKKLRRKINFATQYWMSWFNLVCKFFISYWKQQRRACFENFLSSAKRQWRRGRCDTQGRGQFSTLMKCALVISVPSKVRNCVVSPDNLRSAIPFSRTSNVLNLMR